MAVRLPLQVFDNVEPVLQIGEMPQVVVDLINDGASWAYGNNSSGPSAKLEVNTANGTLLSGQPFVDTYYIAGAYTTRVDRFSTAAETPNVSMSTDNYNRLRVNYDSVSLPTGDTNNTQYPLYLDTNNNLRCMTRQDFIDTFVTPALGSLQIWNGTLSYRTQGTYYLTTSPTPANATLVSSTPVATNSVANISAFTSGGIPEAQKQTSDTNYYLARVNYPATSFPFYDADLLRYDLPIYFNSGDEQLYQHTPASWANLLGPYLRYYLATANSGYEINYSMASGNQRGTTYTDTRVTPTGTGYTTRFVNANDYRTQEFPTGTASTISANTKRFYIVRGSTAAYVASSNPSGSVNEGSSVTFTLTTTNVLDGSTFNYAITGITAADISSGSLTGTVTVNSNTGSTSITLVSFDGSESESATCTFTTPDGNKTAVVTITDVAGETVSLEGTSAFPEVSTSLPLSDGSILLGWRFSSNGTIEDYDIDRVPQLNDAGHVDWINTASPSTTYYIRATVHSDGTGGSASQTGQSLNTWLSLASNRSFTFQDNTPSASYGNRSLTYKIEISSSPTGADIVTSGTWQDYPPRTDWYTTEVATNNWRYSVSWGGVIVYEQDGYATKDTVTEITGWDGYTYTRGSVPILIGGNSYGVTQTIPGILATGYYRNNYEGGA